MKIVDNPKPTHCTWTVGHGLNEQECIQPLAPGSDFCWEHTNTIIKNRIILSLAHRVSELENKLNLCAHSGCRAHPMKGKKYCRHHEKFIGF